MSPAAAVVLIAVGVPGNLHLARISSLLQLVFPTFLASLLLHCKKRFMKFPSPAGMSLTKLPLGRNNSVMTSLFPPRESLVVTSRLGTGNSRTFFYGVCYRVLVPVIVSVPDDACIPTDVKISFPPVLEAAIVASPDPLVLSCTAVGPAVAVVLSAVDVESLQVWLNFLLLRGHIILTAFKILNFIKKFELHLKVKKWITLM